jgi:putative flippase GtrA
MNKINYAIQTPGVFTQLARYTVAGIFGTTAHYLVLIYLVEQEIAGVIVASSLGAILGAFTNYVINYYYTFKSDRNHYTAIFQFYIVAGTGFLLNAVLMWLLVNTLHIYYLAAQILTTGVVLIWGFVLNRKWTFRSRAMKPGDG